jgi:amidase
MVSRILVKDNIDSADKMLTTAGSLALVGSKPRQDAFVVQRLRQAGETVQNRG